MGMMDWVSNDENEGSPEAATDGAVGPDDFGDVNDFDDGFDDFGDFDEDLGGDFGDFDDDFEGGDSGNVAELQDRVGELETEVSALSSTMNTVREENKQIGETVSELDETIRKLLDIYEIVTRGINPFVDDAREMGGLDQSGAFGIFEAGEEDDDDLDPSVANADAEAFFDDDFGELDAEGGEVEAERAAEDELEGEERQATPEEALDGDDSMIDEATGDDGGGTDGGGDAGSTFAELKEEYESGEWDGATDGTDVGPDADPSTDDTATEETAAEDSDEAETRTDLDPAVSEAFEGTGDDASSSTETIDETDRAEPTGREASDARPAAETDAYLDALPESFVGESLIFEWTRYLVSVGGTLGATRAFRQYHQFGWISDPVREDLDAYVLGVPASAEPDDPATLSPRHHSESLSYISRLAGDVSESQLLGEIATTGRYTDGIRR